MEQKARHSPGGASSPNPQGQWEVVNLSLVHLGTVMQVAESKSPLCLIPSLFHSLMILKSLKHYKMCKF